MKIVRYRDGAVARLGLLEDSWVHAAGGELFGQLLPREKVGALDELALLPPVSPGKIVALDLTYPDRVAEVVNAAGDAPADDEPLLLLKPPSSLIASGETIIIPPGVESVQHAAQLALVIGRRARNVPRADALDYLLGLTCANDVSLPDPFCGGRNATRARGFDTFCPLGPCIATDLAPDGLAIEARVNETICQATSTGALHPTVPALIEFVSRIMTLYPGDVILTGSPAGVGPLRSGDTITIAIEGIGTLINRVATETPTQV